MGKARDADAAAKWLRDGPPVDVCELRLEALADTDELGAQLRTLSNSALCALVDYMLVGVGFASDGSVAAEAVAEVPPAVRATRVLLAELRRRLR